MTLWISSLTKADTVVIVVVVLLALLTLREMFKPTIDDPMRYHLRIKLGTDNFAIIAQAEDSSWIRTMGGVFCECEVGDFIYIEQTGAPEQTFRVKNIVQMNNTFYTYCVRPS